MLNIRKRFFLLLTIVGLLAGLASCTNKNDYVQVKIEADEYVIVVGETIEVAPVVNKGDSVSQVTLVYTSQDENVATYSNGFVTGNSVGQTVVKAYCQEKAIAYDTVVITVIQDRLPGMDFGDVKASMLKTTTQQLECTFDPAEAEENVALSYVSSNPEVATVDENGLITAVKAGKVTITVVALNLLYENETREIKFEIEVLETDFAINYELNGGQNAESNPAGYDVFNLPIALADASKVGYTFAGWYDNAEFAGEPVTEIAANSYGDITLYAKWDVIEYTVSYDLAGGEGAETNPTTYTVEDTPYALVAPTRLGYKFLGWYAGDAKVESLTVEALGNLELVAKWELVQYSITYNLNGGDWTLNPGDLYEYGKDHAALVADFIVDFNKHSGKTVAADGSDFFARSWMADGSSAGYNFLVSAEYSAKWGWLIDVINEARVARGAAELSANDGQAEARGEVHNFLNLCAPGEKGGNASFGSDYTGAEAYWSKLLKIEILNSFNITSETFNLPVPVRYGYEFLGWYNEADEEVVAVETGSTGNLVVSAKWEIEEYSITYNYNGGLLSIYQYPSRDALVEDFLADYNTARNKSHTAASFAALGSWGEISDASLFLYNETYRAKWAWLVDYIASVAGSANKKAWEAFNNYNSQKELNAANSNYIYSIAYELRGFVGAIQYSKNKNYVTADYSQDAIGNGFWNLIVKPGAVVPVESYVYTDGTIALGAPEKAGNEFLGWYLDGVKVESIDAAVAKDLVLEAKWSHDPIAINYVLNGGELAEEDAKTFNYAEGLAVLPTPTKLGYTFVGWYSDEACTEKVESIAAGLLESVTLYAAWELTVYNISYELNGGEFIRDEVVELYYELDAETEEHLPAYDLFVADFIADYSAFTGVADVTAANFYGKSAKYGLYSFFKDEEMGAKWSWLLDYIVAYANEVKYNGRAYLVLTAGVANFNKYARTNVAALLQQTLITNVSPISMNFKEVDGETFWTACPDQIIQVGTEAVNEYTIAQLPVALATPNKKGAEFVGWYTNADLKNGKVSEITLELLGDITLYARWSDSVINFDTYNITYELDGGALVEGAPTTYVEETGVELKPATRAGYEFKGWYLDAACTQAVTEFTALDKGDKVVYASWEAIEYAITYNAGEGTLPTITIQVGDYADWAALVADFVVDFNAFSGKVVQPDGSDFFARSWMADGSSAGYNFLTSAQYGEKWGALLTIINDARIARGAAALTKDDGQAEARGEVQNLLTKSSAEAGVTAGYGSDYTSEEVWGKVWDHFELIHDEVVLAPTNYTVEDLPYTLAIPGAPAGKEFAGWYDNAELAGEPIYVLPVGTLGDVELWAKYIEERFNITYELNGGVNAENNPARYGRDEEIVLQEPTREGYVFTGWELNGEKIEKIALGTTGDLTLVATWEIAKYTIQFDYNDGTIYGEPVSLDEFATELVKDFNSTGASDALTTTRENFKSTTHPNIKYVFNKPEMLEKYHWLFVFALAEMKLAAEANGTTGEARYTNTVEMMEGLIAGNTATIGGGYAEGRTAFRFWLEGLINNKMVGNGDYPFMTDFSVAENQQKFVDAQGAGMPSEVLEYGAELPAATREHYDFVGWFDGETQVEKATYSCTVVAKWEAVKYEVALDAQGGSLNIEGADLDTFATELIAMFNRDGGSSTETTRENFKATSHPQIKNVFAIAENLAAYKWFFEFALAEIKAAAEANNYTNNTYYSTTVEMLERMINGDTTAIGDSYADARTLFRFWVEGLINSKLPAAADIYAKCMVDYSNASNMARFEAELSAQNSIFKLTVNDKLPTPTREGYIFQGWFDGEDKVEAISGDINLTAKWEIIKFEIQYDLNGGSWQEGLEGPTEFVYNQEVVLQEPVKDGYTFLGWTQASQYVEEIGNEDYFLVAKWKANDQTGYEVILDLNGGQLEKNLDEFATKLVAMFNRDGGSSTETTRESFKATSHPQIKNVFAIAENLAEYKWLFEFALEEITANATANGELKESTYTTTKEMLERMIAGDTTAIGGSYADARTIFRFWVEGLINSKLPTGTAHYAGLMTDFSNPVNMAKFVKLYCPLELTLEPTDELPVAVRENYVFAGWFVDGIKVEHATGDDVLVAEWIHVDDYKWTVEFDLDGGSWENPWAGADLDKFAAELVKDFNSTGASGTETTTRENFKSTSHPNIKYVWNNKENLDKYHWLFVFALAEMKLAAEANGTTGEARYTNTVEMMEGLIAGNTATIGGGYAEGRTAFRFWLEGLINNKMVGNGDYPFMTDFSVAENQQKFVAAIAEAAPVQNEFCAKDVLPTPVREGHLFLGWYAGEELVTAVRSNCTLVAKWVDTATLKYTISYDAQEGTLPEDAVVEFGYNQAVVLPVPTREGYKFLGWYEGETLVETVENRDYVLVAKWEAETAKAIIYNLDGGKLPEDAPKDFLLGVGLETLPTPTRNGYEFLGWFADEACTQAVTSIPAETQEDVVLYASWNKLDVPAKELVVDANNPDAYATYEEAEADALDGDTIKIAAGSYLTISITKSVKVYGANAGVNPNQVDRVDETVFTGDVVICADNVTIDGIKLTENGRIRGHENGVANPTITNVVIQDSTTNPETWSTNAPLFFYTYTAGAVYQNIVITNIKQTDQTNGRPMIFFGGQIDGLTIKNSNFNVSRKNYNDGIKITNADADAHEGEFGIKGDVLISGNHFENFAQYVIWFIDYQEGNYEIINNTFKDNGQTAGSHCAVRMGTYTGADDGKSPVNFLYNTVDNSYSLYRSDANASRNATTQEVKVNYNKLLNCSATYFINNACEYPVDARYNYYDVAVIASSFKNATYDPYYANEEDVPAYVDKENSYKISYELNGGEVENAPEYYSSELGLAKLPVPTKEKHVFMGWTLNGQLVDKLAIGQTGDVTLVATWREDALYVGNGEGDYFYATLAEALAAAKAGDKIILLAGTYEEDVEISVAGLTIAGPNQGVNANGEQRAAEAIIKGVITIKSSASDVRFDGLSFTGNAKIQYTESTTFDGFTFENNKVYDTRASEKAWDESRYGLPGFIQFTMASGGEARNVEIYNNSFVNVPEVNVLINRANNLTVDGNVFKDFGLDAIRTEGGYVYGILSFTNNLFEQSNAEQGGLGIFLYSNAGASGSNTNVIIDNNKFVKVGRDNGTVFTSAIGAYRYQENYTTFTIKNNIFDDCYDHLYIRNNGGNSSIWFCTVENNQFLGLPHNQYYGSYRGSDSESTNPHLAVFTQNYYEDNDGNVITDLSQYADYFKHMASYGTALATKPGEAVTEPVEFWTITYNLNGGTTRDAFVYKYNSLNNAPIALPTLTKANHQFNGWLLEGELVNEIPADAKGNLALVADFTVLEGEVYNIEFVTNKENALWPSRAAYDLQEILDALYADLYEWAQGNGETKAFAEYKADIDAKLKAYEDINLRNTKLGNYPAEDGSTEYFLNVPKYYQKWADFFAVFAKAMLGVNADQNFYTDTYATMVRMYQFTQWTSTGEGYFKSYLPQMCTATKIPQEIPATYRGGQVVTLPELYMENGLEFLGWYDNAEFTGEAISQIVSTDTGDKKFYAKWAEEVKVEKIDVNTISELLLFTTHQLVWTISPDNVTDKSVEFFSSDESVATISAKGLITAVGNGTTTITIKVYGNREKDVKFDLTVYTDDIIDGSYYSESYMEKDDKIQLVAEVVRKDGTTSPVKWSSLTPEIATVDENGVVTALAVGVAKIVATDPNNETLSLEFIVTVLEEMPTGILDLAIRSNESNVFTRYDLNIGGVYSMDIFGSVSKLLSNSALVKDTKYYEKANQTVATYGKMESIEFVTVHYTGNMASGATSAANANYFANSDTVSIHYTTGNDGVYYCLDESMGAWHAGDSGALAIVGKFQWIPTGVMAGANDPQYPVFSISNDYYFEINGQKTSVEMPKPWNYSGRGTDHILNGDGTLSSQANFGQTGFANRDADEFINDQDLPFKIVDGQYYMGTTWWCYTQVYEGRICSSGGNRNSIGIESCVNEGTDLWWTWQKTAQLVADIMLRNDLDITRVRGHHFFAAKNCPQPMLENDLEIWWEFIDLVEAEYELLTEYEGYSVSIVSNNPEIVDNCGRVINQPTETTCVTYTITFTNGTDTQSITLASMVQGLYVGR